MRKKLIGSLLLLIMLILAVSFSQVFAYSVNCVLGNNASNPFPVNVYNRGYAYIVDSMVIATEYPGGFWYDINVTANGPGMLGVYYVKNTFIVDYFNSSGQLITTKSYSIPYHLLAFGGSSGYSDNQDGTIPYNVPGASMMIGRLVIDIHYDNGNAGYGDYIISYPGTGYCLDTDILAIKN